MWMPVLPVTGIHLLPTGVLTKVTGFVDCAFKQSSFPVPRRSCGENGSSLSAILNPRGHQGGRTGHFNIILTSSAPVLIIAWVQVTARCGRKMNFVMSDLIYIALVVGFFVVSGLYVRFCEKL